VKNTPVLVRQQATQLRKLVATGAPKVERAENRRQAMAQARKQAREKREREREREEAMVGLPATHEQRNAVKCSAVKSAML